ncbi:MAG TPA: F0F1 ATP synthase subunit B [Thermoanaerobaculia bacterium]|nr:F0F1 ATP synthase subunit B [Thermoanaerobaculia bacterium]
MIQRLLATLVTLVVALMLWAAPVAAQEGGHTEGGALNPFAGDVGPAIWTLIIFAGVLFVLGKYAWGPILSNLQARENFIFESLEKAKRDRDEAEARLRQYEEKLASARTEASAIVDEGRRDADVVKRRIEEDAHKEADRMIERARREIQIATDTATKELYSLSARLATDMATRIVGKELGPQDHERLIAESIAAINAAPRPQRVA